MKQALAAIMKLFDIHYETGFGSHYLLSLTVMKPALAAIMKLALTVIMKLALAAIMTLFDSHYETVFGSHYLLSLIVIMKLALAFIIYCL